MKKVIISIFLIICLFLTICVLINITNSNDVSNTEANGIFLGEYITGTIYEDGKLVIHSINDDEKCFIDKDKIEELPIDKITSLVFEDENIVMDYESWFKFNEMTENNLLELPSDTWLFKNATSDMYFSFKTIIFNNTNELFRDSFFANNLYKIADKGVYVKEVNDNTYILRQKDINEFKKGNNIIFDDNVVSIGYDDLKDFTNIEKLVMPNATLYLSSGNIEFLNQVNQIDVYKDSMGYNILLEDFSDKLNIIEKNEIPLIRKISSTPNKATLQTIKPYKTTNSPSQYEEIFDLEDEYLINDNIIGFSDSYSNACSKWCGVLRYISNFTASSTHQDDNSINYVASNLSDSSRNTSWVEGVDGNGIGEFIDWDLSCTVDQTEQDFFEICIVNGYAKNDKLWLENNRVKTLLMYVNGLPHAYLELEDTINPQYFDLGEKKVTVPSGETTWYRFEIVDVYSGSKYDDTCLTYLSMDFTGGGH